MVIGLASMMGAGLFYVWAPAAEAAGSGLLVGLGLAAIIATLNALSTTQLAVAHPVAGGVYAYGRRELGAGWGFAAGWLFLAGKTASVGAIALVAGNYLWPEQARWVALAAVAILSVLNMTGIRSTAAVSIAIVTVVLAGLAVLVATVVVDLPPVAPFEGQAGWYGVLQSTGLLFFCFAGYARMATLGEEVRDPSRTLPRAIVGALAIVLLVYLVLGVLCVAVLGSDPLASSSAPLADLVGASSPMGLAVSVVAGVACLGSLIGLLAALSRTSLAMARDGELPGALARISPRSRSPIVAEAAFAVLAVAGVLLLDPAALIGFSACAVLCYYALAHLSAWRQTRSERWLPRAVQTIGLAGCLLLAATLPWEALVFTGAVLAAGFAIRAVRIIVSGRR